MNTPGDFDESCSANKFSTKLIYFHCPKSQKMSLSTASPHFNLGLGMNFCLFVSVCLWHLIILFMVTQSGFSNCSNFWVSPIVD